ncbi:ejaculatory bulb-specific protein 3-like [Eupeodes corollae]|uniref:ejaculatory bulb-specific protein 3-like n=1 Tax=Eupeodes corollae TaxID=290404 RepID=UPI002492CCCA|nr:ejaculatory bulb-specific protein 3-like [Eupeodes corollae]
MKFTLGLCILACALAIASAASTYTTKFDNFDLDMVLNNKRVLANYIKCLNDKGPCTNEGRELKKLLPDALASDCSKCTETQKKNADKVVSHFRKNLPADFDSLLKKYDPKGVYRAKHHL